MLYRLLIEKHSKFNGDSIYSNPFHIHTCIHTHVLFAGQRSGQPSVCVKMWWKSIGSRCREKYKFLFEFAHFLYKFKSNGPNVMKSVTTFDGFKSQAYTLHYNGDTQAPLLILSRICRCDLQINTFFSTANNICTIYVSDLYVEKNVWIYSHIYSLSICAKCVCVCMCERVRF